MNARRALALSLFVLPLLLWGRVALAEDAFGDRAAVQVRRYALVLGVNDGGPERVQLRYAGTDAVALGRLLTQLGGVRPEDAVILLDVDRQGVADGLERLRRLLISAEEDVRTELFFYYSGHSDEQGLLVGGERIGYSALRKELDDLPADVRIGILDSCASGAFTRRKGGTRRAPFLVDDTGEVRGHAFLTSSSEDEESQESDRLRGSFFTYALISGLRGAADSTGDGRVSLNEVYQFAFHETLRRTESTLGGPQHPTYDIQLAGSGDLVLTDLRQVSASLVLAQKLDGRVSIRTREGRLELELRKFAGRPVTLGLESGGYTVIWDDGQVTRESEIVLGDGVSLEIGRSDFEERPVEETVARGGANHDEGRTASGLGTSRALRLVPVNVGLVPPLDINTWVQGPERNHLSLFLLGGRSDVVHGLSWGLGFNWVGEMRGAQGALVNWSTKLDGLQLGFVNMAREARGAQVGVVNVAGTVEGVMVGFVNVAEDAKAAIGLLNFIKRGILHVDVWASDVNLVNVGIKFGARHTYTLISGGFSPAGAPHGSVDFGLGVRLPRLGPLVLDMDVRTGLVIGAGARKTPSFHHQLRAVLNLRLAKHFGLFMGPTLHVNVVPSGRQPVSGGANWGGSIWQLRDNRSGISVLPTLTGDLEAVRVQLWPGGVLGISF